MVSSSCYCVTRDILGCIESTDKYRALAEDFDSFETHNRFLLAIATRDSHVLVPHSASTLLLGHGHLYPYAMSSGVVARNCCSRLSFSALVVFYLPWLGSSTLLTPAQASKHYIVIEFR